MPRNIQAGSQRVKTGGARFGGTKNNNGVRAGGVRVHCGCGDDCKCGQVPTDPRALPISCAEENKPCGDGADGVACCAPLTCHQFGGVIGARCVPGK